MPGGGGTGDGGNPPGTGSTWQLPVGSDGARFFFFSSAAADPCAQMSRDGRSQHRLGGAIRTEIVNAVNGEELREARACSMHTAFDRAHPTAADFCRLLVGGSGSDDEDQGFALIRKPYAPEALVVAINEAFGAPRSIDRKAG